MSDSGNTSALGVGKGAIASAEPESSHSVGVAPAQSKQGLELIDSMGYPLDFCTRCYFDRPAPSIAYIDKNKRNRLVIWWMSRAPLGRLYLDIEDRCLGCAMVAKHKIKVMVLLLLRLGIKL